MIKDYLPICKEDMDRRGWSEVDFVYVIGDAYVDHPSFGPAIISRVLEDNGYKVGIISQPDWKDEKSYTKKTIASMFEKDYKRVAAQYPRQVKAVEDYIAKLSAYEESKETNIDLVAGLTGEMLGEIFAWKQDEWYDELKTLGFYLGKFIYLMDAYEDLKKDEKNDSYNPLRYLEINDEQEFEVLCRLMMTSMLSECAKSFERLPILLHADILRNIIYSGIWSKYEYIQLKKKKRKK